MKYFFLAFSILTLVATIIMYKQSLILKVRGVEVRGTITSITKEMVNQRGTQRSAVIQYMYYPVVMFKADNGQSYTFEVYSEGSANEHAELIGTTLSVTYDPENPKLAIETNSNTMSGGIQVGIIATILFFALGLSFHFSKRMFPQMDLGRKFGN